LKTTFRVLTQTESEHVGRTLIAALDSPIPQVAEHALIALLERRDSAGQRLLLHRWETLDDHWKGMIRQRHGRMEQVLRDAILSDQLGFCARACDAAVFLEQYGLIATLLNVLSNQMAPTADTIAATLLLLADRLYEASSQASADPRRRDPKLVRDHVVRNLEPAVQKYPRYRRREIVEAFATLADRENLVLKQILQDPHHPSFLIVVDVLQKSMRGAVIQLLLSMIDDPQAPSAALSLLGNRADVGFVRQVLRKIGGNPSATVRQNLKRIASIGWLKNIRLYLGELDDAAQEGLVRMVMLSNIPRSQAFSTIEELMQHGGATGRRAAVEALVDFKGTDANTVVLAALDDPDAAVQAAAVSQLRSRGMTGILSRLVEMLESPHVIVRQAVRKNLEEFSFERYLAMYDVLDDAIRQANGVLVRKVDPQTIPLLEAELNSAVRSRRLRGLAIARTIDLVEQLEAVIIGLLSDDDARVRGEAATALSTGRSPLGTAALEEALSDPSVLVREAVEKSLATRAQFTQWKTAMADPRD
jgi:HEAT repeat protein